MSAIIPAAAVKGAGLQTVSVDAEHTVLLSDEAIGLTGADSHGTVSELHALHSHAVPLHPFAFE
jgi:hypothetical protein